MGRKDQYSEKVQPHLDKVKKWITDLTEGQIAKKLGITQQTFEKYKKEHPELVEALKEGTQDLCEELHDTMKRKAKGFVYIETKITEDEKNGKKVETFKKYAQPDTVALHLLLKNLDPNWHNDDITTIKFKEKQQEIEQEKLKMKEWV